MNTTSHMMELPEGAEPWVPPKPRPLASITAAASLLTSKSIEKTRHKVASAQSQTSSAWQSDAWDMLDLVGEQRFLAHTLANRLGQARLYVGHLPDSTVDSPTPVTEGLAVEAFDSFAGSPAALSQRLVRLGVNLFIPGEAWIVGVPSHLLEEDGDNQPDAVPDPGNVQRIGPTIQSQEDLDLRDLHWFVLSLDELKRTKDGLLEIDLGLIGLDKVTVPSAQVWPIRAWRPHPRRAGEADSPTRSSLPVLRELVGLTMHVGAQVDSRLAGAGLLLVPQKAADAIKQQQGRDADEDVDAFTEALIDAMVTPISDRASASAVVPLTVTVPDDTIEKFRHMTFSGSLDPEARVLRDEAIRRLALGQDAPPELLLGVGSMNHWGAWLVREDVVTTHLEPPLALICDALTSQFLWPILRQQGMDREEVENYVIWYDVSHMIARPNRSKDALDLYDRGELTGDAARLELGFNNSDAPDKVRVDPVIESALKLATAAPTLAQNPGLPALVDQLRALYEGKSADEAAAEMDDIEVTETGEVDPETGEPIDSGGDDDGGFVPDTSGDDAPIDDDLTASSAPLKARPTYLNLTSTLHETEGEGEGRSEGDSE